MKTIICIVETFPSTTEHFVKNEILQLIKKGVPIVLIAQKKQPDLSGIANDLFLPCLYDKPHFYILGLCHGMVFRTKATFSTLIKCFYKGVFSLADLLANFKNFMIALGFAFQLRKLDSPHFHAHFAFWPSHIGQLLSGIFNSTFSLTLHAQDIYCNRKQLLQHMLKNATFAITCTRFNWNYLTQTFPMCAEKLAHIYHGIDLDKWPYIKKDRINTDQICLLSIGRIVPKKGHQFLIKAVKTLKQEGFPIKCNIIGNGPLMSELIELVRFLELDDCISFLGALNQHELVKYYHSSDIFILPCIRASNNDVDGLPNVLLESMACGLPVISCSVSAITELIKHEQTGLLVNEKSSNEVVQSVKTLISNHALYNNISINGRKHLEKHFQIEYGTDKLIEILINNNV